MSPFALSFRPDAAPPPIGAGEDDGLIASLYELILLEPHAAAGWLDF